MTPVTKTVSKKAIKAKAEQARKAALDASAHRAGHLRHLNAHPHLDPLNRKKEREWSDE